jgi:cation diffusion facilitator CzcD-associated flavoprotein CzcO
MKHATRYTVAIVGGGIAGLSTAWYLQQRGIDYVLLERDGRWGGKIRTERVAGTATRPSWSKAARTRSSPRSRGARRWRGNSAWATR